jgi:hypothetical protein
VIRVAAAYVFSLGGFFFFLAMLFRRYFLALLALGAFIICYGLMYLKAALIGPAWILFIYFGTRFFCRESAVRLYFLLALPFLLGAGWFALSPQTANPGGNLIQFTYMGVVLFRLYAVTSDAMGFYYAFFDNHPHTYWSHVSIINLFLHYPYGADTIANKLQSDFQLGNYNASFLATDAIAAYGYHALPLVGLVVGLVFVMINTAARGLGPTSRGVVTAMPTLAIQNIPFMTTLLTNGIGFLILYLAWLPREWLSRKRDI